MWGFFYVSLWQRGHPTRYPSKFAVFWCEALKKGRGCPKLWGLYQTRTSCDVLFMKCFVSSSTASFTDGSRCIFLLQDTEIWCVFEIEFSPRANLINKACGSVRMTSSSQEKVQWSQTRRKPEEASQCLLYWIVSLRAVCLIVLKERECPQTLLNNQKYFALTFSFNNIYSFINWSVYLRKKEKKKKNSCCQDCVMLF